MCTEHKKKHNTKFDIELFYYIMYFTSWTINESFARDLQRLLNDDGATVPRFETEFLPLEQTDLYFFKSTNLGVTLKMTYCRE